MKLEKSREIGILDGTFVVIIDGTFIVSGTHFIVSVFHKNALYCLEKNKKLVKFFYVTTELVRVYFLITAGGCLSRFIVKRFFWKSNYNKSSKLYNLN